MARAIGAGRTILMRGHGATVLAGTVRHAVYISIYLELNAKLQMQAMALGSIKFLTPGETDAVIARTGPYSINRAWENWCRRAGRPVTDLDVS
jgi:HCOMODA/2-hydroxy-3-carboxy-muconic semialdehyde decarboxylase